MDPITVRVCFRAVNIDESQREKLMEEFKAKLLEILEKYKPEDVEIDSYWY